MIDTEELEKQLELKLKRYNPRSTGQRHIDLGEEIFQLRKLIAESKIHKLDPTQHKIDVALRSHQSKIENRRSTLGQAWAVKKVEVNNV